MSSYDLQTSTVQSEVASPTLTWFPWRRMRIYKTLFVIASMLDVLLTFLLLQTGSFYESNPVANHVLENWGFLGMTLYKLVIVFGVLMIANIISIWRVNTSRLLLTFGTVITSAVVFYSSLLILGYWHN